MNISKRFGLAGNLHRVNEDNNTVFNLKDIKQTLVLQRPVFFHKIQRSQLMKNVQLNPFVDSFRIWKISLQQYTKPNSLFRQWVYTE